MNKTVLLVEDDFYIRELYQRAIELKGFRVLVAATGEEAIEIYEKEHPDVVLLDIMLPTMSGMDVLKHIKAEAKSDEKVPVIMVTNLDNPEFCDEAETLGADDYWVKSQKTPMDAAESINHYII